MRDHLNARALIKECENKARTKDKTLADSFKKLKEGIDEHMAVEERAIFSYFSQDESLYSDEIKRLLKEHDALREIISEIEDAINKSKEVSFSRFKDVLTRHEASEETVLYKRLDSELNEEQRKTILSHIKKMAQ